MPKAQGDEMAWRMWFRELQAFMENPNDRKMIVFRRDTET